jgi:hypothetical protein
MTELKTQACAIEQRLRRDAVYKVWGAPEVEAADTISSLIAELEAAQENAARYQCLLKQKASPSTTVYGECTLTFDIAGEAIHAWGRTLEAGEKYQADLCLALRTENERMKALLATLQPTPPEPVNQMLLAALKIVRGKHGCGALTLPVADLERVDAAITAAEQAPQPTELTDADVAAALAAWFSKEFEYNSSMETRMRAAVLAAQKGKA